MTSSRTEARLPSVLTIDVTDDSVRVELSDGRTVSAPLAWYPRLSHGSPAERDNWRLLAGGQGVHWEDLDEDISVENLLAGNPSAESQQSLRRWLEARKSDS